jgi:hypothetical protein
MMRCEDERSNIDFDDGNIDKGVSFDRMFGETEFWCIETVKIDFLAIWVPTRSISLVELCLSFSRSKSFSGVFRCFQAFQHKNFFYRDCFDFNF